MRKFYRGVGHPDADLRQHLDSAGRNCDRSVRGQVQNRRLIVAINLCWEFATTEKICEFLDGPQHTSGFPVYVVVIDRLFVESFGRVRYNALLWQRLNLFRIIRFNLAGWQVST